MDIRQFNIKENHYPNSVGTGAFRTNKFIDDHSDAEEIGEPLKLYSNQGPIKKQTNNSLKVQPVNLKKRKLLVEQAKGPYVDITPSKEELKLHPIEMEAYDSSHQYENDNRLRINLKGVRGNKTPSGMNLESFAANTTNHPLNNNNLFNLDRLDLP